MAVRVADLVGDSAFAPVPTSKVFEPTFRGCADFVGAQIHRATATPLTAGALSSFDLGMSTFRDLLHSQASAADRVAAAFRGDLAGATLGERYIQSPHLALVSDGIASWSGSFADHVVAHHVGATSLGASHALPSPLDGYLTLERGIQELSFPVGSRFADTINGIGALTRKADPLLEIGVLSTLAARDLAQRLTAFDAPWRALFENSIHQTMFTGLAEQALTPLGEAIADLLYPPGTLAGDVRLVFRRTIAEERRQQAIERIAARICWAPRNPQVQRALWARAERDRISIVELQHRELCTAVVLVLDTEDQAQRIRIGRQWFTDENGHIEPVVPLDLDFDQYWQWLRNKAIATAEDSVLDCPARGPWRARDVLDPPSSPNQPSPIVRIDAGPDRWNQNDLADPADVDPLLWLLAHEQQVERAALLRSLVQIATPRQRQLLALLHEGLNTADAARLLGIEPETARTQLKRLRDKARQTLWRKIV